MQARPLVLVVLVLALALTLGSARPVPAATPPGTVRPTAPIRPIDRTREFCPPNFFAPLGDLPGEAIESVANDVSADGSRVVGGSAADEAFTTKDGDAATWRHAYEAFGWTRPCRGTRFWHARRQFGFGGMPPFWMTSGWGGPGIFGLGYPLDALHLESDAAGISPDGRAVAGNSNFGGTDYSTISHRPYVWGPGYGQMLGILPNHAYGEASDVSDPIDPKNSSAARIVVGHSNSQINHPNLSPGARPVYWRLSSTSAKALPIPISVANESGEANGVSDDGGVIAGNLYDPTNAGPQFLRSHGCVWWLPAGGANYQAQLLADLPEGEDECHVYGISGDGRTIVGSGTTAAGVRPCYWRRAPIMGGSSGSTTPFGPAIPLELATGAESGFALGANYSGSVIGGGYSDADDVYALRWKATSSGGVPGMNPSYGTPQRVEDLLATKSITMPAGWHLWWVRRLSADGQTFIGDGYVPDASDPTLVTYQGWIAHVP